MIAFCKTGFHHGEDGCQFTAEPHRKGVLSYIEYSLGTVDTIHST